MVSFGQFWQSDCDDGGLARGGADILQPDCTANKKSKIENWKFKILAEKKFKDIDFEIELLKLEISKTGI